MDSGPRVLAMLTSMPARANSRARADPMFPLPAIAYRVGVVIVWLLILVNL
jgi:hypothetical protein